jgi:hypothetical protein
MADAATRIREADECCPRCTRLADYVRACADLVGLRDWEFQVAHDEPAAGNDAEIDLVPGRRIGRLRIAPALEGDDLRHGVAHELGHALCANLMDTVREGARDELGGAAYRVYVGAVDREHERLADTLAVVLGPVLPLP